LLVYGERENSNRRIGETILVAVIIKKNTILGLGSYQNRGQKVIEFLKKLKINCTYGFG